LWPKIFLLIFLFLFLAASHRGRAAPNNPDTNNNDPELGLEILPEDTFDDRPPPNHHDDIDHDEDIFSDEGAGGVDEDIAENARRPRFHRFSSVQTTVSSFSKSWTLKDRTTWQKVKSFVFPPKEDIDSFTPNYRHTPILSGLIIPFSILLEIPGLTEHWYIRTENNQVVESRANPHILNVGLGISLGCAVIANIYLITRFLDKRVKTMTILCVAFLTFHGTYHHVATGPSLFTCTAIDIINIVAVTTFGVQHRLDDGFLFGPI